MCKNFCVNRTAKYWIYWIHLLVYIKLCTLSKYNKKYDFKYKLMYKESYFFVIKSISLNYDINNSLTTNSAPRIIITHEIGLLSSFFENKL